MLIVGCDPGKDGAIVCLEDGKVTDKWVMPTIGKEIDIHELDLIIKQCSSPDTHCIIENVHAMGRVGAGTTFAFGRAKGLLEMAVVANGLAFTLVAPKEWQKEMWKGVKEQRKPPKKLTKKELKAKEAGEKVRTPNPKGAIDTKAMSLVAVRRLFPKVDLRGSEESTKPHDGIIDAILMAEYGRRLLLGNN